MHDDDHDEPQEADKFDLENVLFAFLGAWLATVVCMMVYFPSEPPTREPAEEAAPLPEPSPVLDPPDYFLSFNSSHFEK